VGFEEPHCGSSEEYLVGFSRKGRMMEGSEGDDMLAWGHAGGDRRKGRLVPSQLLSRACQWEKNKVWKDKGWMGR
jgi:hypothetical protein